MCCLLLVALVGLAVEVVQYSRTSLMGNGRWVSSKLMLPGGLVGDVEWWITRNALHQNHLDLGAWHGFQEVSLNRVFHPVMLEFRFRLDPRAHLSVLFNRDDMGYDGVRVSRHPLFASLVFHASRQSAFARTRPLGALDLDSRWHAMRLDFRDRELEVTLDRVVLGRFPVETRRRQFIGFRAGSAPALIDDVRAVDVTGAPVVAETFRNTRAWGEVVMLVTLAAAAAGLLARQGVQLLGPAATRRHILMTLVTLQLAALACLALYSCFDYFVWSRLYPYEGPTPPLSFNSRLAMHFEDLRSRAFVTRMDTRDARDSARFTPRPLEEVRRSVSRWNLTDPEISYTPGAFSVLSAGDAPVAVADESARSFPVKPPATVRVGFIGTSQIFGSGAESAPETLASRVHRSLSAHVSPTWRLETFNFGIPGSTASEILERYRTYWTSLQLDLLIINLSFNDPSGSILAAKVEEMVRIARASGTAVVLTLEAASLEAVPEQERLAENHRALRAVGARTDVPVLDLNGFLNEPPRYDSGFLWWDMVHLSSCGQSLAAEWLSAHLTPHLERALAARRSGR